MSGTNRRVPPSLSELRKKRDDDERNAARPVFFSKNKRTTTPTPSVGPPPSARPLKRPRHSFSDAPASKDIRLRHDSSADFERERIRRHYMRDRSTDYVASSRRRPDSRFRFDWDSTDDTTLQDDESLRHLRMSSGSSLSSRPLMQSRVTHSDDPRHWSEKPVADMTDRDWRIFREDYLISVRSTAGGGAPLPARSWSETGLPESLLRLIRDVARYEKPSPIQMASIPVGLARRDCIGLAETGSGKTAAFVLPMMVYISEMPRMTPKIAAGGPYALVLAPTRELALQIDAETRKFADALGYRVVHIIGGQQLDVQATALQAGCEIVVCTPGRMVDLLSKQMAVLSNCNYLILDEADRMIDMGFEPQVTEILDSMPLQSEGMTKKRQTFMFSATMSPPVERLAKTYLHEPVVISIGETGKAADNVDQKVEYFTTENQRRERFISLLETLQPPILVFVNTRGGCEMVQRFVEASSFVHPMILHSGKSQDQRERTLDGFKTGRHPVLIATDVVGRGIDIKGVRHVINFELPKNIEAYTHRIGRTGRAGEKGTAWSLAMEADTELFTHLCSLLQQSKAQIPKEISSAARGNMRAITD